MIKYVKRTGSNCIKWDGQKDSFGEEGLLGMWVADMDFQVADCIRDALHKYIDFGVFGYSAPSEGCISSFINWEKRIHGYEVKREWLRFSPGVVPAFNWFVQILTAPGEAVLVNTPVYYPFLNAIKNNGRRLITSELLNSGGVYTVDLADFEKQITENQVKLFILCSPHNPVSRVWTAEELKGMLDICRRHGVYVISDEIHHDLTFGGHEHIPSATVGEYDDMLVTLTAPSKTFNLAGCQNSVVIIPDVAIRAKFDNFTDRIRITNGNSMGYIAAEAGYTGGETWLSEVKEIIYGNYLYLREQLRRDLPGVTVSPLEGTYLMWADFGAYLAPEQMEGFFQKKCRLALDYGKWFGGSAECCVRFNLATARENIETAANRIIAALKA